MHEEMTLLKVGLTGGIACGKSTVTKRLGEKGVPIIDADQIAHQLVQPGQQALKEIIACFGDEYLLASGELDRKALGNKVFSDKSALAKLEAITHPLIRQEMMARIKHAESQSNNQMAYLLVDIPLLIEKGYVELFDRILVIDCMPEQQLERVLLRDNMSLEKAKAILANQSERERRLQYATDIIDNTKDLSHFYENIEKFHDQMQRQHLINTQQLMDLK
jgi:dephospho-CoA kinase